MMTTAMHNLMASIGSAVAGQATDVPPLRLLHREVEMVSAGGGALERAMFRGTAVSETAQASDALYMLIFWFSLFFFVLLMFLMIYWTIKYRRRPGVPPEVSPSHNTILELIWTIVPSASLIVIFFAGFWTYMEKQVATSDAYELQIKAKMWNWTPVYHNGANSQWFLTLDEQVDPVTGLTWKSVQENPVIVVPEDTQIRLLMDSADVIHSFWIPDFRVKSDVYPNRYTTFTFKTPKLEPTEDLPSVGYRYQDHWVFCAEYCGDLHSEMAAILRVVPKDVFDALVTSWNTGDLPLDELGQIVATAQGCFACHNVSGDSGGAGPTWLNMFGYPGELVGGAVVENRDENYLRESILDPNAKVRAREGGQAYGVMQSYQGLLSERELDGLVAYMKSLSDRGQTSGDGDEAAVDGEAEEAGEAAADVEAGAVDGTMEE